MLKKLTVLGAAVLCFALSAAELPSFASFSKKTGVMTLVDLNAVGLIQFFGPQWEAITSGIMRPDEGYPKFDEGFEIKGSFKSAGTEKIPLATELKAVPGAEPESITMTVKVTPEKPVKCNSLSYQILFSTADETPKFFVDGREVKLPAEEGSQILFDRPMRRNLTVTGAAGSLTISGNCTVFIQDGRKSERMTLRLTPLSFKKPVAAWDLKFDMAFKPAEQ